MGGELLCLMMEHVFKTIGICEEVKYNEDDKLDRLKIVHSELKDDYLVQHLHRSLCYLSHLGTADAVF